MEVMKYLITVAAFIIFDILLFLLFNSLRRGVIKVKMDQYKTQ